MTVYNDCSFKRKIILYKQKHEITFSDPAAPTLRQAYKAATAAPQEHDELLDAVLDALAHARDVMMRARRRRLCRRRRRLSGEVALGDVIDAAHWPAVATPSGKNLKNLWSGTKT